MIRYASTGGSDWIASITACTRQVLRLNLPGD
jgi:hypothetical protein